MNPSFEDLEDAGRKIRIEGLKDIVREESGEEMMVESSGSLPPEIEEKFWEQVIDFEQSDWVKLSDALRRHDVLLPTPESLNDPEIKEKIVELATVLARLGVYLEDTDHLSDREFYVQLCDDVLQEEYKLFPDRPECGIHCSMIGSGSEEDVEIYLRYYADEETRAEWQLDSPDYSIPPHMALPFDRDRHFPKHEFDMPGSETSSMG